MMERDPRKKKSPLYKQLSASKPKMTPELREVLNAYHTISRGRKYAGQYASPCPLTEKDVLEYISLHGACGYESDILINIVLNLDNHYLELDAKRRKKDG